MPRTPDVLKLLPLSLGLFLLGDVAGAQSMQPLLFAPTSQLRPSTPPPLRLAERAGVQPLAVLEPALQAARAKVDQLIRWNRAGKLPVRNGLARDLPATRRVSFGPEPFAPGRVAGEHDGGLVERTAAGEVVWGAEVRVAAAYGLRLHLADINLPEETLLWVYGESGDSVGPFGLELEGPEGDLWTPTVEGEVIRLEVRLPAGGGRSDAVSGFSIDRVLEIFDGTSGALGGASVAPRLGECLVDAQCITSGTFALVDFVQQAVATISFLDGGFSYLCSGGLLNSAASPSPSYFLTAHHCFDNQASATSLEAVWDFYTDSCNGTVPNYFSLPRSNGSTLLATAASSDYTLVLLNSRPANRVLLGWNANASAAANGTVLNRISHPVHPDSFVLLPQQYSRNHVNTSALTCAGAPRPDFLYETYFPGMGDLGGTFGGSSGAPAVNGSGQTLGQLTGACGFNPEDGCDYSNAEVDGGFSESFGGLAPYLLPSIFSDGFESGDTSAWSATVP
jgi:lysyl endopeptidase